MIWRYLFLTRKNIADSFIGEIGFAIFILIVALVSPLPIALGLVFIYFLTAFCVAFIVSIIIYILDNFLKAYFLEIHKRAFEFNLRIKKEAFQIAIDEKILGKCPVPLAGTGPKPRQHAFSAVQHDSLLRHLLAVLKVNLIGKRRNADYVKPIATTATGTVS